MGSHTSSEAEAQTAEVGHNSESTEAWVRRVHHTQCERLSPERREELQRSVEQSRLRVQQARKCKAVSHHARRSHMLVHESMRQMSCSAPEERLGVSSRWFSASAASEARQNRRMQRIEASQRATAEVELSESSDEDEAVAEMAALVGAVDVGRLPVGGTAGAGCSVSKEFEELLQQVKTEPTDAEDCAAKFSLYEGYSTQLEKIRKLLFEYYEETSPTVPAAVDRTWKHQLKKIDSAEAMGIVDDDGRIWFVYHMMRIAEKNNSSMSLVLGDFQRKIELLAQNDQTECPVCLEYFTEPGSLRAPETLGCCHKICGECWKQWKEVTHGHPFCPLCRNDEFLGIMANRATA